MPHVVVVKTEVVALRLEAAFRREFRPPRLLQWTCGHRLEPLLQIIVLTEAIMRGGPAAGLILVTVCGVFTGMWFYLSDSVYH